MSAARVEREAVYFESLKTISSFDSTERLRRDSERAYGLPYEEALEMAYENIMAIAKRTIRGRLNPRNSEKKGTHDR